MSNLFVFRRDLRTVDNCALSHCLNESKSVQCCFIFTPEQVIENEFKSERAIRFMIESLEDLSRSLSTMGLSLCYRSGDPVEVIAALCTEHHISAVYYNTDYTPYARDRDRRIAEWCAANGVQCKVYEDALLLPVIGETLHPYKKFTPFYNAAKQLPIAPEHKYDKVPTDLKIPSEGILEKPEVYSVQGGRGAIIDALPQLIRDYTSRDTLEPTTGLSPYIKFGCVSPREIYRLRPPEPLLRQLYWRDFYYRVMWYWPNVISGGPSASDRNFNPKYRKIKWKQVLPAEWTEGRTGFPIVDAGMRQLQGGYMHNRARLLTASFLIKDLHVDWQLGEKFFAQQLVDYDPAVNNGNWQWVAGSGVDSQPYFRVFNPWLQSAKYDPDAAYIKQHIPALKDVPAAHLHNWAQHYKKYPDVDYPAPMCDHDAEKQVAIRMYEAVH